MGTYVVSISKTETETFQVVAEDATQAEQIALQEADDFWEPDTTDVQVDDVSETVKP
jgi:hypothetical protein